MKVLDIGCGFGSLAKYMADNCGADVVAFTNSVGMGEEARNRCKGSNVKIQVCDWRDIQGKYDRISSIKMIEHVGGNNWTEFFKKLDSLLNEGTPDLGHPKSVFFDSVKPVQNRFYNFPNKPVFTCSKTGFRFIFCIQFLVIKFANFFKFALFKTDF